jgi:hypothetical protein
LAVRVAAGVCCGAGLALRWVHCSAEAAFLPTRVDILRTTAVSYQTGTAKRYAKLAWGYAENTSMTMRFHEAKKSPLLRAFMWSEKPALSHKNSDKSQ